MNLVLHQCGVCGRASFEFGFFSFGASVHFNEDGRVQEICGECVDDLLERTGMYELRDNIQNPSKKVK